MSSTDDDVVTGPARLRVLPRAPVEDRAECADATHRLLAAATTTCEPGERRRLRDEAVLLNLGAAEAIAARYARRGESFEDLVQVARVGLVKAAGRFDPDHGGAFLAYAVPTMTGEIKRHFRDHAWTVRPPRRLQELKGALAHAVNDLAQELGRSPRAGEVAVRVGVETDDVVEALAAEHAYMAKSLDEPLLGGDGAGLADSLGTDEPGIERVETVAVLRPLCEELTPRARLIVYRYYFCGWKQTEIAAELGISQMQVSRLLSRALASLRTRLDAAESTVPEPPHAA